MVTVALLGSPVSSGRNLLALSFRLSLFSSMSFRMQGVVAITLVSEAASKIVSTVMASLAGTVARFP